LSRGVTGGGEGWYTGARGHSHGHMAEVMQMERGILAKVTNNGEFLVLDDGRVLEVDHRDVAMAVLWPPTTPLEISKMDDDPFYDLRVKGLGESKEIRACWS
jgi:hypothetical protein